MVANRATLLHWKGCSAIDNIGHSLHTLLPHSGIGSIECSLTLLIREAATHLTYGAGEACKARTRGNGSTQVGEFDVAMCIDKASRQGSRVELGAGHGIQPLPLSHTHDAAIVIEFNDRTGHDLPAVDKVVGGDGTHSLSGCR